MTNGETSFLLFNHDNRRRFSSQIPASFHVNLNCTSIISFLLVLDSFRSLRRLWKHDEPASIALGQLEVSIPQHQSFPLCLEPLGWSIALLQTFLACSLAKRIGHLIEHFFQVVGVVRTQRLPVQDFFFERCIFIVQCHSFRVGQGVFAQGREELLIVLLCKQLDFIQAPVFLFERTRLRTQQIRRLLSFEHFIGPSSLRRGYGF